MATRGAARVLAGYLRVLAMTVVFPLIWLRAWRIAQRHRDDDPRGPLRVGVAIVLGVALAGAGALGVLAFQEAATEGIYDSLEDRLRTHTLEQEYQDQLTAIAAKEGPDGQIAKVEGNLRAKEAALMDNRSLVFAGDDGAQSRWMSNWTALRAEGDRLVAAAGQGQKPVFTTYEAIQQAVTSQWNQAVGAHVDDDAQARQLNGLVKEAAAFPATEAQAVHERVTATARRDALAGHHTLFGQLQPAIQARQDAQVRSAIEAFNAAHGGSDDIDTGKVETAFAIKQDAVDDMRTMVLWLLWPSVAGLLFAPLAFALGSVLRRAWVPSDSVGYKQYPGAAAGLFLLFGGFGVPALPFAAWTFYDMQVRSEEGQIAL